ncbi:MAG: peptidylprolyl isomerase [Bacteroidota bacterium]
MPLTSTIRKHSGLAAGIIAIGLILLLIGGDIIQLSAVLSGRQSNDVGEIAGQKITLQAYQDQIEQLRRLNPSSDSMSETLIRDRAWKQLIAQRNYEKEYDALGITISEDELVDMVQGAHIHPELQIAFRDPKTNQFDKRQLIRYLQQIAKMPEAQRMQWRQFEHGIATLRQREKFMQLMVQSALVTDLEAQSQYDVAQKTRHVKYLYIPYGTYPDDAVQITNKMLKDYLSAHKSAYQIEESRRIQYVVFPITPTKADEQAFQDELHALKVSFAQVHDNRFFAKTNTDGAPESSYFSSTLQQLPSSIATQKRHLKPGMVIGPVQEDNIYKLYKVAAIHQKADEPYEIAVIEKKLLPGDHTRDQLFRKADYCASTIKNAAQLETYAAQAALKLQEAHVGKHDVQVGSLDQARELVRWLYNDAAVNQVSPVFELDNEYVVAVMTEYLAPGTAPLLQVRDVIARKVRNQKKADAIMAKITQLGNMALEALATQYGQEAQLLEKKQLRFEDDTLPKAGMARRAIGAAFALHPGTQTTVADENGVLVVEVVKENNEAAVEEIEMHQKSLIQLTKIKQSYEILQALEVLTPVKDNRHRFY